MKPTISRLLPLLFMAALLAACGAQQADTYFESIAPARLLTLQKAIAVVQADLDLDKHPNPMEDNAYFAKIEPDVQALHLAAKDAADIQKDTKKATGGTSVKYAGMDETLGKLASISDGLVNYFEHPKEAAKPAYQLVQKSLNSLDDSFKIALTMYTAAGGPGIPTPVPPAGATPVATAKP